MRPTYSGPSAEAINAVLDRVVGWPAELDEVARCRGELMWAPHHPAQLAMRNALARAGRTDAEAAADAAVREVLPGGHGAVNELVGALLCADLVGRYGYTRDHHDLLLAPWRATIEGDPRSRVAVKAAAACADAAEVFAVADAALT